MDSNPSTSSSSGNGGRFGAGGPAGGSTRSDFPPSAAFSDAAARLAELKEYAAYWVAARLDGFKSSGIKIATYAVLGLIGGVVACSLVATSAVLLLWGLAEGLGVLCAHWFGVGWYWLGPFVVGLLVLAGIAAGAVFGLRWFAGMMHAQLVAKYEDRKRQQRIKYGFDVKQRAREQRAAEREARREGN